MITKLEFQDIEASQPEGVKTIFGGQGTPSTGLSIKFSAFRELVYLLCRK
tara:strand:+ start:369 stop:518 length:150 start_codon:yes stop_codon:yes gene_type:complete